MHDQVSTIILVDRWFSEWDVSFASEGKMQTRANELVQGHLVGRNVAFSFLLKDGGEEVRTAQCIVKSSHKGSIRTGKALVEIFVCMSSVMVVFHHDLL